MNEQSSPAKPSSAISFSDLVAAPAFQRAAGLMLAILAGLLFCYWTSLEEIAAKWEHDPQYSHGYLVPLFSIVLLWMRREMVDPSKLRLNWLGLPVILAGLGMRLAATHYYVEWFDFLSIIPVVFGITLLLGGWHAVRWAWPAIGFLFFMIPLPYTLEVKLRGPLRSIGTMASTYLMQTIGLPAVAEGNVVVVGEVRIGVVEACSGLNMLMVFFALSTGVALLSDRPAWERLLIIISAVPIALISNIARITVTGILYALGFSYLADLVFHDLAGYLMMPFGLLLLWFELWLLSRILISEDQRPMAVGLQMTGTGLASAEGSNRP